MYASLNLLRGGGVLLLLLLVGCEGYPKDPEGTWERIEREGVRVGVAEDGTYIQIKGSPGRRPVEGREASLVRRMFADLGLEVAEWEPGASDELMEKLERFELDMVIGGYTTTSPWRSRVAFTRPYYVDFVTDRRHVLALPPGENRWLMKVDHWIATHETREVEER